MSGVSQKLGGAGAVSSDAAIVAGQVLYRLRLDAKGFTAGTVFDGAAPGAKWRAELRDKTGATVVARSGFAIGRLEVQ